jgi:hypothetical protein
VKLSIKSRHQKTQIIQTIVQYTIKSFFITVGELDASIIDGIDIRDRQIYYAGEHIENGILYEVEIY